MKIDLNRPEYYVNRELSWLKFNLRVLREAGVRTLPLLERMRFVAISASNLDEFFMVRVAGLIEQEAAGVDKVDAAGLTVADQLREISLSAHNQMKLKYRYFFALLNELGKNDIRFLRVKDVTPEQRQELEAYYQEMVFPVLTPMAVDAARPFPLLANKTLNIAVELRNKKGEQRVAFVQVPSVLPRFISLVEQEGNRSYVFLEDLIMEHCQDLFKGLTIVDMVPFRITRDSDLEVEEDATQDLMKEIERSLRKRKRGAAVRLEICTTDDRYLKDFLVRSLDLEPRDVYEIGGPLDLTFLNKFIDQPGMEQWKFTPYVNQQPEELPDYEDLFGKIREHDILLHHPYESFDPIVKLLATAAEDPNVLAIKQTLYRVSGNSPLVAALARAAENGKQVTALVELKARFDEENNIVWARRLEKAGCHVIYGLMGLKTHSKIILIVRKEEDGIRRYVHLGTGNYNDKTARLYTDLGLLTANDQYGQDASAFFNVLSGYSEPPVFNRLVMAPIGLREKIYELVDREIANVKNGGQGHIIAKMNSLIDQPVIRKFYEASQAGVKIELIVRGICGLRPGIKGVSDNITVRSIIGRFLEHSRVYYFANNGSEELYLSSADMMPRNLNDRVELLFPVERKAHIDRIKEFLDLCLKDNVGAHVMLANGTWRRSYAHGHQRISVQAALMQRAMKNAPKKSMPMEQRLKPMEHKEE
ncbi:MAG: RNA degradosome polyphosphate kinase [Acidaminococcus sp.]|uniref:RNA degradosome polyphosphate kinase n=1 Tax=Acidaminococcus TaxID=904 RepID=UPI0026E10DD5|nr:RNA degradosome polyphosphate kinase [Acidaminococcus sp.]MDO5597622.1 RNA degradosome polyphosphate kinase [Acidaminococcus sp.]